jgi:hypothetical protein
MHCRQSLALFLLLASVAVADAGPDNPQILPNALVGTPYSSPANSGCPTCLNYDVTSGSLPPGITINPTTGIISGTPTSTGVFSFGLRISVLHVGPPISFVFAYYQITVTAAPGPVAGVPVSAVGLLAMTAGLAIVGMLEMRRHRN